MPQRSGAKNSAGDEPWARASTPNPLMRVADRSLAPADKRTLSIEEEIDMQVRRFRRSMDLTVAQLSMNAGISAGMLSNRERHDLAVAFDAVRAGKALTCR